MYEQVVASRRRISERLSTANQVPIISTLLASKLLRAASYCASKGIHAGLLLACAPEFDPAFCQTERVHPATFPEVDETTLAFWFVCHRHTCISLTWCSLQTHGSY